MAEVPLGVSAYNRFDGRLPNIIVRNFYSEANPTDQIGKIVHIQRPGLKSFAKPGAKGPIRGVFKQDGVFGSNDFITVAGTQAHRVTEGGKGTLLGNVGGTENVSIAASTTRAIIVSNGTAYSTGGSVIKTVNMPNNVPVGSVAYMNGYFLLTQLGSHRIWWIDPGADNPDGLNFFSAENNSDDCVKIEHISDMLFVFKQTSVEVFTPTGDANNPFQRQEGMLYDKGCANRATVTKTDNTIFWVGRDKIVYRAAIAPQRISDFAIEEKLMKTDFTLLRAWSFPFNGHVFYALTIGDLGTFVYDVAAGGWVEWATYGRPQWQAHLGAWTDGSLVVAGDAWTNDLWQLDSTLSVDNKTLPIERELVGGLPITGKPEPCHSFSLYCATGWANQKAPNPVVQMRMSDDGGNLWSAWRNSAHMGRRGQFGVEVAWRQLGMMKQPGRMFHIRCGDPTLFRVSYARINEAYAT